jgi:hypothetical protein
MDFGGMVVVVLTLTSLCQCARPIDEAEVQDQTSF